MSLSHHIEVETHGFIRSEAMMWLSRRADERAARGVLGVNVK